MQASLVLESEETELSIFPILKLETMETLKILTAARQHELLNQAGPEKMLLPLRLRSAKRHALPQITLEWMNETMET
jgi:hypothetical protein